MNMITMRVV